MFRKPQRSNLFMNIRNAYSLLGIFCVAHFVKETILNVLRANKWEGSSCAVKEQTASQSTSLGSCYKVCALKRLTQEDRKHKTCMGQKTRWPEHRSKESSALRLCSLTVVLKTDSMNRTKQQLQFRVISRSAKSRARRDHCAVRQLTPPHQTC
jgi:hypothetical protein